MLDPGEALEMRRYIRKNMDGTVLLFAYPSAFKNSIRVFTYVAYRAQSKWYTSASELNSTVPQIIDSDEELIELLESCDTYASPLFATQWTKP